MKFAKTSLAAGALTALQSNRELVWTEKMAGWNPLSGQWSSQRETWSQRQVCCQNLRSHIFRRYLIPETHQTSGICATPLTPKQCRQDAFWELIKVWSHLPCEHQIPNKTKMTMTIVPGRAPTAWVSNHPTSRCNMASKYLSKARRTTESIQLLVRCVCLEPAEI